MAGNRSPFEAMPLELHFRVVSYLSSPEDVRATIRASPAALGALQTGRERVYAAVLQTCLAPEVFREFLAIVNAPDPSGRPYMGPPQPVGAWSGFDPIRKEWDTWLETVTDFVRNHAAGASYPTPDPKVNVAEFKTKINFIVRLYFCLSKFVNFFPTFVQSNAARKWPISLDANEFGQQVQGDDGWPPLTDTELLRLQRGLLRHELCCRLVGLPSVTAVADRGNHHVTLIYCDLWFQKDFSPLFPLDEVEEVVCAAVYVRKLYDGLHWRFAEESQDAILHSSQSHVEGLLDKGGLDTRNDPVGEWVSDNALADRRHFNCYVGGLGTQLGLVVLDRVMRSTVKDRQEFMRGAYHTLKRWGLHFEGFHRTPWYAVNRYGHPISVGPHCSPIVQTFSTEDSDIRIVAQRGIPALRKLGWVFLDNQARLRSLPFPLDARASSTSQRMVNFALIYPRRPCGREMVKWALKAPSSEDEEEEELFMDKYWGKDRRVDFEAKSRFVAGVRAVVDFKSNKLPQMDQGVAQDSYTG